MNACQQLRWEHGGGLHGDGSMGWEHGGVIMSLPVPKLCIQSCECKVALFPGSSPVRADEKYTARTEENLGMRLSVINVATTGKDDRYSMPCSIGIGSS